MAQEMMQGGTAKYEDGKHRAWLEIATNVKVWGKFRDTVEEADADLEQMIEANADIEASKGNQVRMFRVAPGTIH